MTLTLAGLISGNRDALIDSIVKDAVYQVLPYRNAPIRRTIERTERWLDTLAESIRKNDPDVLERFLMGVADERREEGYVVSELHAIIYITEHHVRQAIGRETSDTIERNGLLALLDAVMGAARMVLSVRYIIGGRNDLAQHGIDA